MQRQHLNDRFHCIHWKYLKASKPKRPSHICRLSTVAPAQPSKENEIIYNRREFALEGAVSSVLSPVPSTSMMSLFPAQIFRETQARIERDYHELLDRKKVFGILEEDARTPKCLLSWLLLSIHPSHFVKYVCRVSRGKLGIFPVMHKESSTAWRFKCQPFSHV